jgi:uncharacterized OsmC-like protein
MIAEVTYLGNLRTELKHLASGTILVTDAPIDNHGRGDSFSPTDLVAAALLSCEITVMDIARQKHQMPELEYTGKVFKTMSTEPPRKITSLTIYIQISGATLTNEQQQILIDAALNCPVALSLDPAIEKNVRIVFK